MQLHCSDCGRDYPPTTLFRCQACESILEAAYDEPIGTDFGRTGETLFERYGHRLPSRGSVAGDEGETPLVRASGLADALGVSATVYVKDERRNPTGSFKDRAFAPAISFAAESGWEAVVTASTGNAAAACARYATKAGLDCYLLSDEDAPAKKLLEPRVYGADVVRVPELFAGGETALGELLGTVAERSEAYLGFAYQPFNPVPAEGVKTISYEIAEQLVPDVVVTATGGGDNIAAQYRGFRELRDAGVISQTPRMVAVQATGAAPIADAVATGADSPTTVQSPTTVASGIDAPFAGQHGLDAVRASGGTAVTVTDEELIEGVTTLSQSMGIWPEPASATVVPALERLSRRGDIDADDTVVVTVTGSGHKHTEPVEGRLGEVSTVTRDANAIVDALGS